MRQPLCAKKYKSYLLCFLFERRAFDKREDRAPTPAKHTAFIIPEGRLPKISPKTVKIIPTAKRAIKQSRIPPESLSEKKPDIMAEAISVTSADNSTPLPGSSKLITANEVIRVTKHIHKSDKRQRIGIIRGPSVIFFNHLIFNIKKASE